MAAQETRGDARLSVMASDFGAALDSIFDTDDSLFSLSIDLQQKKENVDKQNRELEELEARLREAEGRLKKVKRQSEVFSSPPRSESSASGSASASKAPANAPAEQRMNGSPTPTRTAFPQQSLTAPPPLNRPHSSVGNEYVMVDRTDSRRPATSQRA